MSQATAESGVRSQELRGCRAAPGKAAPPAQEGGEEPAGPEGRPGARAVPQDGTPSKPGPSHTVPPLPLCRWETDTERGWFFLAPHPSVTQLLLDTLQRQSSSRVLVCEAQKNRVKVPPEFPAAAVTKRHTLSGSKQHNFIICGSEGQTSGGTLLD